MFILWALVLVFLGLISATIGFSSRAPDGAIVAGRALTAVFAVAFVLYLFLAAMNDFQAWPFGR